LVALWFLVLEQRRVGKKTPVITGAQTRKVFTRLLRRPAPGAARIAAEVTRVPRRSEEARIHAWHAATRPASV
jgi:hypothetical protein